MIDNDYIENSSKMQILFLKMVLSYNQIGKVKLELNGKSRYELICLSKFWEGKSLVFFSFFNCVFFKLS